MRNTLFVIFFIPALILSQCIEGDCIDGMEKFLYENIIHMKVILKWLEKWPGYFD